jgi:hypothetical protein
MSLEENIDVFVLPLDTEESPMYISCFGNGNDTKQKINNYGQFINNIPSDNENITDFHPQWVKMTNDKIEIDQDMARITDFEMSLAKFHRHFRIVIPFTFLQSGALTMGQLQTTHPFVPPVFKLKNAIDYLISSEGITECWAGERKGDPVLNPEPRVANGKPIPLRPEDKIHQHTRVALIAPSTPNDDEMRGYFCYGQSGGDDNVSEEPPVEVNPSDLMMRLVENNETIASVPRVRVYYEIIPQNDPTFETKNPIPIPNSQLFDKTSEISAIVFHYVILDPRLDLMKGLLRIHEKAVEFKEKQFDSIDNLDKMKGKIPEAEPNRYSISAAEYVSAIAIMTDRIGEMDDPDFIEPLTEKIFRSSHEGGKLDISEQLDISKGIHFAKYARVSPMRTNSNGEIVPLDDHIQLCYESKTLIIEKRDNRSLLGRALELAEEVEFGEIGDSLDVETRLREDRSEILIGKVYCFPIPTRVSSIPPGLVHPVIFSNCLLPHLGNTARNKKKLLVYDIPVDEKLKTSMFEYGTLMLPKLEIGCKVQLMNHIREKRDTWRRMDRKSKPAALFLVDILRMKHGAINLSSTIDCAIKENQSTPVEIAREIRDNLQADLMSDEPNAPVPMIKMAEYIKEQQKKNPNWSLFCNVYKDLSFKDYDGLTCCSNYIANMFHLLDIVYAVRQAHKLFILIMVLAGLVMKLNFKDQFYLLMMGDPDSGKSWVAKLFFTLFCIFGTHTENNSESAQVVNNINRKMVGVIKFKDDGDSNITTGPKEINANNSVKSVLSSGKTSRAVVDMDKPQGERVSDQQVDNRGEVICCKNGSKEDMPPSILTRVLIMYVRLFKRLLNTSQSEQRRDNQTTIGGDPLPIYREKLQNHGKNFQLFQSLIWYFIRGGGILYSERENEKKASRDAFERFVAAVSALLKQNIKLSMRMQSGQLFPLMEGFMILRIWSHINSGTIQDPKSHLRPGAPFNFEFIQELSERGLLLPIQEDLMMAISYMDPIFSHEIVKEIVQYIKTNIEIGTGAVNETDKARLSFTNVKNWLNYERIFFQERSVITGVYETNFNWIDLGAICDLQNTAIDEATIVENLAMNIKTRIGDEVFSVNDLQQAIFDMLSEREEEKFESEFYCKQIDQTTNVHRIVMKMNTDGSPMMLCSSIMKCVMQVPRELQQSGKKARHLLIRSDYIKKYVISSTDTLLRCVSNPDFVGSTTEHAMNYAFSYVNGPSGKVALPGMTLDRPLHNNGLKSNPQIMKVIEMRNDLPKEFFNPVRLSNKLQVGPKNYYEGRNPDNTEKDEIFYKYSTFRYLQSLKASLQSYGFIKNDGIVLRKPIELEKAFTMKYVTSEWYKLYSPCGLENTFNNNRKSRLSLKGGTIAPDYIQSMIEFELDSAGIKAGNLHNPKMEPIYADLEDRESVMSVENDTQMDDDYVEVEEEEGDDYDDDYLIKRQRNKY